VTVGAADVHGSCRMHRGLIGRRVAGDAAGGFSVGFFLGLAAERGGLL